VTITFDNLEGAGPIDYSSCVCPMPPLTIERVLNAPSKCSGLLDVSATGLPVPARRARVIVTAANGTTLFTGYVATDVEMLYAGNSSTGPVYRIAFRAVSDEWLLDKQTTWLGGPSLAQTASQVLATLANRVDAGLIGTAGLSGGRSLGVFQPSSTQPWSANAGDAASSAYSAYRVLDGVATLLPAGSVTHALSDGDGTLQISSLQTTAVKELANDVTLSGEIEPTAYVTEVFEGDGVTTVFQLSDAPYKSKAAGNSSLLVNDSFNQGVFNPRTWVLSDPGSHLGLSSAGLAMSGGSGLDGQTTLTALDAFEMGGTLVVEAGSVQLGGASDGVLCGLYSGAIQRANCFAGYNVRQSAGATVVVPYLNGAEVGTVYPLVSGHNYTLRMRLHCVETQRVMQLYYAMVDGAVQTFGGGVVAAPMSIVFELQDLGAAANTPATVLYDGSVTASPASCSFAAVNSVQLTGSMGYCRVQQTGSGWVVSTLPSGTKMTRLIGTSGEGVDCTLSAAGKVTFFSGRIPVVGEFVIVTYRSRQRSVARLQDASSIAAEALADVPGSAAWLGKVVQPEARSSADCENAALAVLGFSTSRAAATAGTYTAVRTADVWPGDLLALSTSDMTTNVIVRQVVIEAAGACPETLTYRMGFANDWAEGLGMRLSEAIATDAVLPQTASTTSGNVLANLQQLQLVSATNTALQVDAGTAPPAGGGFEVRRRDWDFGAQVDQDLVLRSPVRSFSIPRAAQIERYFVRMYDASNPPLYSRFSSAVITDLPVG
jgi:hypothetical protein